MDNTVLIRSQGLSYSEHTLMLGFFIVDKMFIIVN